MMKVSLIIPIFNCERYIQRCIQSIQRQGYKNLEIIIIDDGSTDNSLFICNSYSKRDDRIKVIHKENGGQSSARNLGLDNSTGDLIGFVDADDWIEDNTIGYLVNLIEYNNADIANIRCQFIRSHDAKETKSKYEESICYGKEGLEKLMYEAVVGIPGSLGVVRGIYKREIMKNIRFVEGRINEDMVFCYEAYKNSTKTIFSTRICYNYFMSPQSTTRGPLRKKELDLLWACDQLRDLSKGESFGKIKEYVDVKSARSYFSLLAKAAFWGIDESQVRKKEIIPALTNQLRKNWWKLIKSSIPINRKIMITAFCVNFRIVELPLRIFKKLR